MTKYRLSFEIETEADPSWLLDELTEMIETNYFEDTVYEGSETVENIDDETPRNEMSKMSDSMIASKLLTE